MLSLISKRNLKDAVLVYDLNLEILRQKMKYWRTANKENFFFKDLFVPIGKLDSH